LLEAVVGRAVRHASVALDAAEPSRGPAVEALDRVIAAGWSELVRHSTIADAAAEQLSPAALTLAHRAGRQRIRDLIERGRREGAFRTDVPIDWLVAAFFGSCMPAVRRFAPAASNGVRLPMLSGAQFETPSRGGVDRCFSATRRPRLRPRRHVSVDRLPLSLRPVAQIRRRIGLERVSAVL
jgi:hypothetical protein